MDDSLLKEIRNEILSWVGMIAFALVVSIFITNVIIVNAKIPSGSMEPTIMTNDRVVAYRLAYLSEKPKRFDIIVFPAPDEPEILYVKRIIGLPGEKLTMINGEVFINDSETPLDSSFVNGELVGDFGPIEIPPKGYFVMGDNRTNSKDARFWKKPFVMEDDISGKVVFRYFKKFKIYK